MGCQQPIGAQPPRIAIDLFTLGWAVLGFNQQQSIFARKFTEECGISLYFGHVSCRLRFEVNFPKAVRTICGDPPPVRVIAFDTTVLRAPWADFNNFVFFGKFRASSVGPAGFLVFLNQTCLFQNQISKISCVFLLYGIGTLGY